MVKQFQFGGTFPDDMNKMDKEMACKPVPKSLISGLKELPYVFVLLIII